MITPGDIQFAREHLEDDIHGLLLGKHKYPGVDVPSCVIQIEGLRKMRQKIPEWFSCRQIVVPSRSFGETTGLAIVSISQS